MKLLIVCSLLVAALSAYGVPPYRGNSWAQPNPFGPGPYGYGGFVDPYNYYQDYHHRHHRRHHPHRSSSSSSEERDPRSSSEESRSWEDSKSWENSKSWEDSKSWENSRSSEEHSREYDDYDFRGPWGTWGFPFYQYYGQQPYVVASAPATNVAADTSASSTYGSSAVASDSTATASGY